MFRVAISREIVPSQMTQYNIECFTSDMSLTAELFRTIYHVVCLIVLFFFLFADAIWTQDFPEANKWNTTKNKYRKQFVYFIEKEQRSRMRSRRKSGLMGTGGQNVVRGLIGTWKLLWINHRSRWDTTFAYSDSLQLPSKAAKE